MTQRITNQMIESQIASLSKQTGLTVEYEQQSGYHNVLIGGSRILTASTKSDLYDQLAAMTNLMYALDRNAHDRNGKLADIYSKLYDTGYDAGYKDGRSEGYNAGLEKARMIIATT